MGSTGGNRGTHIFVSAQELEASKSPQPDLRLRETPLADLPTPTPHKLHKRKKEKVQPEVKLPVKVKYTESSENTFEVHRGSPWIRYKKILTLLDFAGEIIVSRKKASLEMVGVTLINTVKEDETLEWLRKLRHGNIVAAFEAFSTETALYVVYEEMHIPLEHIVKSPAFPSSEEIGTILGQILDGLIFLETHGRTHGSLNCDNVLLHRTGLVKLGDGAQYDSFVPATSEAKVSDLKELATITMRLMQKYALDNGKVGVENPTHWRESQILDFLSSIMSATGPRQPRRHFFLHQIWRKGSRWPVEALCDLITVAQHTVPRDYRWST
ncbi:hypothetical protein RJ55_08686 [Drechmeria coniospora]|nr:hypothetical protein RJ55_08686 [Drechmeria coniospora]